MRRRILKFFALVSVVTVMGLVATSCGDDKEDNANDRSILVGTDWTGNVTNTIDVGGGGGQRAVDLLAEISFLTESTADMAVTVTVAGTSPVQETANLTYVFDGEHGTFTDPADGNVVDFTYNADGPTLTYDLYLRILNQRIGGTFVMTKK